MKKYKLGIALGGGGARGFAHLGVLKALFEKGVQPDAIAGVSAGALVGAFIASGKSPDETMQLMRETKLTDFAKVGLPVTGLLSLGDMNKVLNEYIEEERIEDLKLPFFITVANLLTGEVEYKEKGDLIAYVQASSSIPVLFSPVMIDGIPYVDGGLVDNLPVAPLEDCCEHIIGVSISPVQEVDEVENMIQIAARTFQISVNSQLDKIREKCDTFIEPDGMADFGLLDTSKADELFELGYNYTLEQIDWDSIPRKEDA